MSLWVVDVLRNFFGETLFGFLGTAWDAVQCVFRDMLGLHRPFILTGLVCVLFAAVLLLTAWNRWPSMRSSNFAQRIEEALGKRRAAGIPYPDGLVLNLGTQKDPDLVEIRVPDDMMDWLAHPNPSSPFSWDLHECLQAVYVYRDFYDGAPFQPAFWRYLVQAELRSQFERSRPVDLIRAAQAVYEELHRIYWLAARRYLTILDDPAFQVIRKTIERDRTQGRFWRGIVVVSMGSHSGLPSFPIDPLSDEDMETFLYGLDSIARDNLIKRLSQQYLPSTSSRKVLDSFYWDMRDGVFEMDRKMRQSIVATNGKPARDFLKHWSHEVYRMIQTALASSLGRSLQQCASLDHLQLCTADHTNSSMYDLTV